MPDKKPTIRKEASVTYTLRGIPHGGWADITLREWKGGGSFSCLSDFGEFTHVWGSIGESNLRQFLCRLDKDYFLKKTRPNDYRLFSVEKTCQEIRRQILEMRRENDISADDARLCWNETHEVDGRTESSEGFYHEMHQLDIIEKVYCGDPCALPACTEYNPMCDLFWERVWPHIVEYWKGQEDGCESKSTQ